MTIDRTVPESTSWVESMAQEKNYRDGRLIVRAPVVLQMRNIAASASSWSVLRCHHFPDAGLSVAWRVGPEGVLYVEDMFDAGNKCHEADT